MTPTPLERLLQEATSFSLKTQEEEWTCDAGCGVNIEKVKYLITHAYEVGRNDAVDFIDREFNDERYAYFAGEDDDDEPVSTEEEAEFRMFWTDLLREARGEGK